MNVRRILPRLFLFLSLLPATRAAIAQNPIVPPGVYMADPTARVWDDGKLYIYGSVDENTSDYCSHRYHVLSTENMLDWTIHEHSFISRGEGDQVPYSDALLYAPDCQARGDTFYLYYCQPDRDYAEGVAVSTDPAGPFLNGTAINVGEYQEIDPCLFIDDDGQGYYMWGQMSLKMAKMNPDMRTIDPGTVIDSVITEKAHYFHEGAHMVKRNGLYYLLYAHLGRADMPTCIGYCTGPSPTGPFRYGGVIVDNDHCDPGNWNNHGSIMEYHGQWYVFYHRSSHGSKMMRRMCVEPIRFNDDGSINEVEMTSQGAGPPLSAASQIPAERACLLQGNVRVEAVGDRNEALTGIRDEDRAAYKYLDFGAGVDSIRVRVKPGKHAGGISFRAGMPWGPYLGYAEVPVSEREAWIELAVPVNPGERVTGIRALWLVFDGEGEELFSVDWLRFQ